MKPKKFELKSEHLQLLKNFNVGWCECEFGAPEIDPKRPYGNSDVYQDMLEILGLKEIKEGIFEFTLNGEKWILKGEDENNIYLDGKDEEKLTKKLRQIHEETETALQICIQTQKFETGTYIEDGMGNWRKVGR